MTPLDSLRTAYGDLITLTDTLDDETAWLATGCAGWAVRDLVHHLLFDAQRALVALATPAEGPADVDAVNYWRAWQPGTASADASRRAVRIAASVWSGVQPLVALYGQTARGVLVQAARTDGASLVATQGYTVSVDDLLATLAVEATVHHLDMVACWDSATGPSTQGLALVRRTLDGLLGRAAPSDWDAKRYALIGTGRARITRAERVALGDDADRLPLFG